MTERELAIIAGAIGCLLLALAAMAALHERHYKSRAERILEAKATGKIDDRVACLEAILSEDRLT